MISHALQVLDSSDAADRAADRAAIAADLKAAREEIARGEGIPEGEVEAYLHQLKTTAR